MSQHSTLLRRRRYRHTGRMLLGLVAWIQPGPGLAPAQVGDTQTFRIESRFIEVPVVVRDRKTGAPVAGLKTSDFLLLENGKAQDFQLIGAEEAALAKQEHTPQNNNAVFRNRRQHSASAFAAVLIDGYNARFEDQVFAAKAAAQTIDQSKNAAQWALYLLRRSGIRILHDYSTDTQSLVTRLASMRAGGDFGFGIGSDFGLPSSQSELERKAASGMADAEMRLRLLVTLNGIRDIGRHLSALPGRKSLIWMTAGISMNAVLSMMPDLWHSTIDNLNDAGVAVYAVDSMGIRTTGGYLAEQAGARTPQIQRGLGSQMEPTQAMQSIAAETGGIAFLNSNDLAKGVREALVDTRAFYRLVYRTSHSKWDGRQVSLRVKLRNRKTRDVDLRYRRSFTASPLKPVDKPHRERLLADAIVTPLEAVEVGITARFLEGTSAADHSRLLRLTLDPGSVSLDEDSGSKRLRGGFDVRVVQASVDAKVVDDVTDEVKLDLDRAKAERTFLEGFSYEMKLSVHDEARTLKVAFCDHATGRLGTLRVQLP